MVGGTTWEISYGSGLTRYSACAACVKAMAALVGHAHAAAVVPAPSSRLRVRPLLASSRCIRCGNMLAPDVAALRRELAARAEDVACLQRSVVDAATRHLVFRRRVRRDQLLAVQALADAVMRGAEPDEALTRAETGQAYMRRWWLRRARAEEQSSCAIYLHAFDRPDLPPPHDHPWRSAALLVRGILVEQVFGGNGKEMYAERLHPGDVVIRSAEHRHLLRPLPTPEGGAVTVFATGGREREWGFIHPDGTTRRDRAHGLTGKRAGKAI